MLHYLNTNEYEEMPDWLLNYRSGDKPALNLMTQSVCYPGSGEDYEPVKALAQAHCTHIFVYFDYIIYDNEYLKKIISNSPIPGYHSIGSTPYDLDEDLTPKDFKTTLTQPELQKSLHNTFDRKYRLARLIVFAADHDSRQRIPILFVSADAILFYDKLFASHLMPPPLLLVLQDHGWGGNYSKFGKGGLLDAVAQRSHVLPTYLLVASNTDSWDGYEREPHHVHGIHSGMYHRLHELYSKAPSANR